MLFLFYTVFSGQGIRCTQARDHQGAVIICGMSVSWVCYSAYSIVIILADLVARSGKLGVILLYDPTRFIPVHLFEFCVLLTSWFASVVLSSLSY